MALIVDGILEHFGSPSKSAMDPGLNPDLDPDLDQMIRNTDLYSENIIMNIQQIHGTFIRWYLRNRCARKKQSLLMCLMCFMSSRVVTN